MYYSLLIFRIFDCVGFFDSFRLAVFCWSANSLASTLFFFERHAIKKTPGQDSRDENKETDAVKDAEEVKTR